MARKTAKPKLINGTDVADTLFGKAQSDRIDGRGGNDNLLGAEGADWISGGAGNDRLNGGTGNDILLGDDGDDRLNGGAGMDTMTGGAGADIFVIGTGSRALPDGSINAKTADLITDFASIADGGDRDRLDLSGLVKALGKPVSFSGDTAAAYSVWQGAYKKGTAIYIDITGDAVADLAVRFKTVETLSAADFIGVDVAAPSVELVEDTGLPGDKITSRGALKVTALAGTTVEYSFNGTDWTASYEPGADGAKTVFVRQKDAAGNVSAPTRFDYTLDTNQFAVSPISDTDTVADAVAENVAIGTAVGIAAFAEGKDLAKNTVTYSLTDSAGGAFQIDSATGKVTVKDGAKIDYEALGPEKSLTITVKATSALGTFSTRDFAIAIKNADDAPTFDNKPQNTEFAIPENQAASTFVWDFHASDSDNNAISYSLSGDDAKWFDIDLDGKVTFKPNADFEMEGDADRNNIYKVTIAATANKKPVTQDITVKVTDVAGDPPPVINASALDPVRGFTITGAAANNRAGGSVSDAGDINGDGFDDLIVGAPYADPNGKNGAGASYVIYGSAMGKAATAFNLTATAGKEKLIGGWGNDTITNIGTEDSARGGAGDDVLEVISTTFTDIDGGHGFDTLKIMGAGDIFDFTKVLKDANNKDYILDGRVDSIEAFDLSAAGAQTLKLDRNDVFHLSDNTIQKTVNGTTTSVTTLYVLGSVNGGSLVLARDSDPDNNATDTWVAGATGLSVSRYTGITFNEYVNGNIRVLTDIGDVGVALNV